MRKSVDIIGYCTYGRIYFFVWTNNNNRIDDNRRKTSGTMTSDNSHNDMSQLVPAGSVNP